MPRITVMVTIALSACLFAERSFCQKDSVLLLQPVVVSGLKVTRPNGTPINISSIAVQKMRANGSFNIADALAKTPGISQLNTGVGISKPVIRGLYGNTFKQYYRVCVSTTNNGRMSMAWD